MAIPGILIENTGIPLYGWDLKGLPLRYNKTPMKDEFYPDLKYPLSDLTAYSLAIGKFVISLKSEEIICFEPKDANSFKNWLEKYNVRNVDEEE